MYNDEYEPTELEDELFLSDIPLEIMKSSIRAQFSEPLENRKRDYIQSFITKYEFSKSNSYEDDLNNVEMLHDDFINFITKLFDETLDVSFVNLEDMDDDDKHELLHLTYRFFIKNIKKNFITIIINYLNLHKEELTDELPRKKDVTTLHFKQEISNDTDVIILSNLNTVIDTILEVVRTYTTDDFMDLCRGDDACLETEFVRSKLKNFIITGNFIAKYIDMLDDSFKVEIESKLRNKILKKYPRKKQANNTKKDSEHGKDESVND